MFKKAKVIILIAVIMALTLVLAIPASASTKDDFEGFTYFYDVGGYYGEVSVNSNVTLEEKVNKLGVVIWTSKASEASSDNSYSFSSGYLVFDLEYNTSVNLGNISGLSATSFYYHSDGGQRQGNISLNSWRDTFDLDYRKYSYNGRYCYEEKITVDLSKMPTNAFNNFKLQTWFDSPDFCDITITKFSLSYLSKNDYENSADYERNEAESGGNSNVDALGSAVPDKSADLLASFSKLTKSMVHDEAVCNIKFPQIKVPALGQGDGTFFGETVLYDGGNVDMSYYVNLIPQDVLTVIRSVLTVALILFCFKELYGFIEYALTLNKTKGGTD